MLPQYSRRAVPLLMTWLVWVAGTGFSQHIVAPGDTLSEVAIRFSVDADQIARINQITNPDLIFPAQALAIPETTADETSATYVGPTSSYTVQPGETLGEIALLYDLTTADLQSLNGLADPNLLSIGQQLIVPARAPAIAAPQQAPVERPSLPKLDAIIDDLARSDEVDPSLIKAIAYVESGWDQGAVSSAGAIGVMQLQPGTTTWLETEVFEHELNESESIYDNIKGGVRLFRILLDETGNEELAIMAYYQGLGATLEGRVYEETKRYVDAVNVVRQAFWP